MTSAPDPMPLLRTLVGARIERARRAWWVWNDDPVERQYGPLELTTHDGRVLLLDAGRDETLLEVSEQSLEQSWYGRLIIAAGAPPHPEVGGYRVEDVGPTLFSERGALVQSVKPVLLGETQPIVSRSLDDIVGAELTTQRSTVRAYTWADGLLVVQEPRTDVVDAQ